MWRNNKQIINIIGIRLNIRTEIFTPRSSFHCNEVELKNKTVFSNAKKWTILIFG